MKTERLSIKIPQSYKAALMLRANAEGEPVAVVVRRILRTDLEQSGLLVPSSQPQPAAVQG